MAAIQCVQFTKKNGNLVITLLPEGKEFIQEALDDAENIDSDDFMLELFEQNTCNGWNWVEPKDIAALTSAPILSDEVEWDEDGNVTNISMVYWFPNYQEESPVETLFVKGEVVFTGVAK